MPTGVDAIVGVTAAGSERVQSIRFDADRIEPVDALKWLGRNGYMRSGFESAHVGKVLSFEQAYVQSRIIAPAVSDPLLSAVELRCDVVKVDGDKQRVFGWLYVCRRKDGTIVVDHSGEIIKIETLEEASYGYVPNSRKAGNMHGKDSNGNVIPIGFCIECVCFTPEKKSAMGVPEGILPDGMWIGLQVTHAPTWLEFKSGKLRMFSLGGRARREAIKRLAAIAALRSAA